MIVAVKRNRKQKLIRLLSLVLVVIMFIAYYFHMSNEMKMQEMKELEAKKAAQIEENRVNENKKNYERAIVNEIEKAVDLVGQEHVRHVKIIENKLIIICEPNTNLDALMVRYGTMALIKTTLNEIIIAIDIEYIIKSKINA